MKIEIKDLEKIYAGRVVLHIPHLSMGEGIHVVRGPNGSGKSTLLKLIAGIAKPTRGEVKVFGKDPFKSVSVRKRIALVGHRTGLIEDLNGKENAKLFLCGMFGCKKLEKFFHLADILEVSRVLKRPVRTYSKGERTKISIAIALASERDILLLDEPFASLDDSSRRTLASLIKGVKGTAVITAHGDIPDLEGEVFNLGLKTPP